MPAHTARLGFSSSDPGVPDVLQRKQKANISHLVSAFELNAVFEAEEPSCLLSQSVLAVSGAGGLTLILLGLKRESPTCLHAGMNN